MVKDTDGLGSVLKENGATTKAMGFTAFAGPEAATNRRVVVIHGDNVPNGQVGFREVTTSGIREVALGTRGKALGLGNQTGMTLGMLTEHDRSSLGEETRCTRVTGRIQELEMVHADVSKAIMI